MIIRLYCTLLISLTPLCFALADSHQGFVKGVWFDPYPFFAHETVLIKTTLFNQSSEPMRGTLELRADTQLVASSSFVLEQDAIHQPNLTHVFSPGAQKLEINLIHADHVENIVIDSIIHGDIVVDIDTDKDNIGNAEDIDDDNDGHTDQVELSAGSNPLDPSDTPLTQKRDTENTQRDSDQSSSDENTSNTLDQSAFNSIFDTIIKIALLEEALRSTVHENLAELQERYRNELIVSTDPETTLVNGGQSASLQDGASVLFSESPSLIKKTAYSGLSILSFIFSRWWVLVLFIILCLYSYSKIRNLLK